MGGAFFDVRDVELATLEQSVEGIIKNLLEETGLTDVRICDYIYSDKWQDWTCRLWVHS